jgi:putative phage-type endonuclease
MFSFSDVVENMKYMMMDSTYYIGSDSDSDSDSDSYSYSDTDDMWEYIPFTEEEELKIVESLLLLLSTYVDENPSVVYSPSFEDDLLSSVYDTFLVDGEKYGEKNLEDFELLFQVSVELFYISIYPCRSTTDGTKYAAREKDMEKIQQQIDYLNGIYQPAQRTEAWYKFRNGIITASNAYKAFDSQTVMNQLIYEKCAPLKIDGNQYVNIHSPFHWGNKYEPVSVLIYEHEYQTKVGDFGCIQHSKYSYLGASPDGINIDPENKERFGRMLEIKNIVNRVINGIPKKEYWVQMQMQMETCDLDECDFLETQFLEYESGDAFLQDYQDYQNKEDNEDNEHNERNRFLKTAAGEWKGIILYFSKDGIPYYIYKPLLMGKEEYDAWSEEQLDEQEQAGRMWVHSIYWRLKTFSCVYVPRNKIWFERNRHLLESLWRTVEQERESGNYEHRKPTKRVTKTNAEKEKGEKKEIFCIDLSF